ncbi:type II toxin-antitoxin system VapC family toxin [Brevundimonas sp.]|uniref:type II toxin-antitoxin system VapC family toxin n=1 Tax=Brevundimonas sp. TaxID=1871086 RepID=UPI002737B465|nr:type II toxin-antitoxin system VapC family toxin [Brevundimonas sp.]MDP3802508.1 type II toxin-antitoxin system VapC family toxin [Brevundimonas sp.]
MTDRPILLDTCAALWLAAGEMKAPALDEVRSTLSAGIAVLVSPITAWEVGMLASKQRIVLAMPALNWFEGLVEAGIDCAGLSPAILVAATELNAPRLRDPADRIIAATARANRYRLMTRDRPLLDFAAERHGAAIRC